MSLTKFLSKRKRRERKISAGIIPDFKVVTLGESGCGKTSLVQWFLRQRPLMNKELGATVAASFSRHTFEESPGEGGPMMGLWDTAGSERYCALAKLYYRDAFGAILCYDVSDYHSWDRLRYWINELNENKPGCRLYIVGCKADLPREICPERVTELVEKHKAIFFETSSKTGFQINEVFRIIYDDYREQRRIQEKLASDEDAMSGSIHLGEETRSKPCFLC